jgi:hypothetical protein
MGNLDVIAPQTSGNDTVYLSSGADKFILSVGHGCVIINGFGTNDQISLASKFFTSDTNSV